MHSSRSTNLRFQTRRSTRRQQRKKLSRKSRKSRKSTQSNELENTHKKINNNNLSNSDNIELNLQELETEKQKKETEISEIQHQINELKTQHRQLATIIRKSQQHPQYNNINDNSNDYNNPYQILKSKIEKIQSTIEELGSKATSLRILLRGRNLERTMKESKKTQKIKEEEKKKLFISKIKKDIKLIQYDSKFNINEWKAIPNSGQHNCGIFIQEGNNNTIVKCENNNGSLIIYEEIKKLSMEYKIIPEIYRYTFELFKTDKFKRNNDEYQVKYYYEMERFNLDTTQLLFEDLLKKCITEYCNENSINFSENDKQKLYNIFHLLLPKTQGGVNINILLNNSEESQEESQELLYELLKEYIPLNFNEEDYNNIIKYYLNKMLDLGKGIIEQIVLLQYYCFNFNITLNDLKFDNFGVIFKDTNELYFGNTLKSNEYYGKYFFVYALDYESAVSINKEPLSEAEKKTHINTIINLRRWARYGQYQVQIVSTKLNKQLLESLLKTGDSKNEQYNNFISIISNKEKNLYQYENTKLTH